MREELLVDKEVYASTEEACKILGICLSLFYRIKDKGLIKVHRAGKKHFYLKKDLKPELVRHFYSLLNKGTKDVKLHTKKSLESVVL